jgi:hypothetical protein
MAKRKSKKEPTVPVEVSPKDLAKALQGVSDWVLAIRRVVLKLDPKSTLTIDVPTVDGKTRPFIDGCPPPE